MHFVLEELPYNARRERNDDSAKLDLFTAADLREIVEVCKRVIEPAAYGHVFLYSI